MLLKYYQVEKGIALIRFILLSLFLEKKSWRNFRYKQCRFDDYKKISIGKNNKFNVGATISAFSNRQNSIAIGDNNIMDKDSTLMAHGGYILIGDNNYIGFRVQIQGKGGVVIGNKCMIAGNTFISSSNHDFSDPTSNEYLIREIGSKVTISDKVWIGANCVITAGVSIGKGAIIAGGAVVTKNVDAYTMVGGVPSIPIKFYDFKKKIWCGF